MVTTETWTRRTHFRDERWAKLLIDTLYHYRGGAYSLHEFVVMPDHIHVLLTPLTSLEKAVQFIKGGFSFRAKKELGSTVEVWQKGFQDHRVRDAADCVAHVQYIYDNPVKARICQRPEEYPYSSAHPGFELDPVPQGLKPESFRAANGAAEAAPLQNSATGAAEAAPFQNSATDAAEAAPLQNSATDVAETAPFQSKSVSRTETTDRAQQGQRDWKTTKIA